jgi:hypothetical protein
MQLRLVGLVVAGAFAAAPGIAQGAPSAALQAAAGKCAAPTGKNAADASLRRTDAGFRLTTYNDDTSYNVALCKPDGGLKRSEAYARIKVPDGGAAYLPVTTITPTEGGIESRSVTYPAADDPKFKKAWEGLAGEKLRASVLEPNEPGRLKTAVAKAAHYTPPGYLDKCNDTRYNLYLDGRSYRTSWYGSSGTLATGRGFGYYSALPNASWETLIEQGRQTWDDRWNDCGFALAPMTWSYHAGSTFNNSMNNADGVNTIGGWSDGTGAVCGVIALACTWVRADTSVSSPGPGGKQYNIVESDMFFDMSQPWTAGAVAGWYSVACVAAHEWGHAYGLGHVGEEDSRWSVIMFPQASQCYGSDQGRYLGRGDVYGMGAFYPA